MAYRGREQPLQQRERTVKNHASLAPCIRARGELSLVEDLVDIDVVRGAGVEVTRAYVRAQLELLRLQSRSANESPGIARGENAPRRAA